jgi:hypothetical protein
MNNILNELSIADRLKYMATNGVKNAVDRALTVSGSGKARGRLILRAGTAKLYKGWREYVGREELAGNKDIEDNPTITDLVNYLDTAYSLNMSAETIERIMNGGAPSEEEQSSENSETTSDVYNKLKELLTNFHKQNPAHSIKLSQPTFDFIHSKTNIDIENIKQILQKFIDEGFLKDNGKGSYDIIIDNNHPSTNESISRREFEYFKNMFNSNALYEDVVLMEKAEFDPRTLFPKIANILIKNGTMTVDLGDGKGGSTGGGNNATFGVNAQEMKKNLETFHLTSKNIDFIKNTDLRIIYKKTRIDSVVTNTVIGLVYSLSKSWSNKIDSTKNITASGNTIDMSILVKSLSDHLYGNFKVLEIIKRDTDKDRNKAILEMEKILKGSSSKAEMICDIAYAVAQAITKA